MDSDLGLGFVLNQGRLVEDGLKAHAVSLFDELIKSLEALGEGGGVVTVGNDDKSTPRKSSEPGGFETGVEDGMVNADQLGLGR